MNIIIRCGVNPGRPTMRRGERVLIDVSFDGVLGTLWMLPCENCGERPGTGYHFGVVAAEEVISAPVMTRLLQLRTDELPAAFAAIELAARRFGTDVTMFGVAEVN